MTFHKPMGEANMYVQFGYGAHKIYNHTQGKVSVSMNADTMNANKQVKNKRRKYEK